MQENNEKMSNDIKLVRRNNLVGEFALIDGVGRDGKAMMGHILSTMDRVEKLNIDESFDIVRNLYMLGKVTHDAAVTVMRTEADARLYNNMISRSVNFRFSDGSGVSKNLATGKYIKRGFIPNRGESQ